MSRLVWDSPGEKVFEAGLDRGVLYAAHQRGRAWNGLVSVVEGEEGGENVPLYQDGVKRYNRVIPGDYTATIEAYTYPNQFEPALGYAAEPGGLYVGNQTPRPFSMSYRTGIGNDLENLNYGYRIHIIYNATVVLSPITRTTVEDVISPDIFSWNITTEPPVVDGFRPTSHWIIDSRYTDALLLQTIENVLWGGERGNSHLIPAEKLLTLYREWYPTGYGYGLYGRTNGYGHGNEYDFLG